MFRPRRKGHDGPPGDARRLWYDIGKPDVIRVQKRPGFRPKAQTEQCKSLLTAAYDESITPA